MSKERKLLEKVAVQLLVFDLKKASDLVDEIQELLAQPETDLKREPPLSDDELVAMAVEDEFLLFCSEDEFIEIARAIEKAHGIGGGE